MKMPLRLSNVTRLLSLNFIWLLLACYALAVALPLPGERLRETVVVPGLLFGNPFTIPLLLLSILFFNVGTDLVPQTRTSQAGVRSVGIVVAGGWLVPVLLLSIARPLFDRLLPAWCGELFIGLVLVAAMPIANSSTAWAHNLGADVGHSVWSLIWSTLLAPFVSVLTVSWLWVEGSQGTGLKQALTTQILAGLFCCVVVPIAMGALFSRMRNRSTRTSGDVSKLINMAILLILNYSNAALALREAVRSGHYNRLWMAFGCVAVTCACLLLAARLISRWQKWSMPLATSAALSMSMKNTGAALVLAGSVLTPGSLAILVIVGYTLVQHMFVSVAVGPVRLDAQSRPVEPAVLERLRQDSEPPLLTASQVG
jgi:BASS family bile acid:Na+ symporter